MVALSYIEVDDIPLPLVPDSKYQRSSLAPFSPSTQSGATSRVTDARLAVQVWGDFTGGLGQRDEATAENTAYSEGNLDTRVAGAIALPPLPSLLTATAFVNADAPVYAEYMRGGPTATTLFLWSPRTTKAQQWRNGALTTRPAETVRGWAGAGPTSATAGYWYLARSGADTRVYRTADAGGTWTLAATIAGKDCYGLVWWDNRFLTYNATDKAVYTSTDGVTWAVQTSSIFLYAGETVRKLAVWMAPGGNRTTVYAVTNLRILGYEEEALEWHEYYSFEGVFTAEYADAHMWRRDSNLYLAPFDNPGATAPDKNGAVLMFTPGTADEVGLAKRFGLPDGLVDGIFKLQGGVHWLFGFAYGNPGGVFALNEFQGWTMLFDGRTVGGGTAKCIGGGYANGRLWALNDDGNLYEMLAPDRRELPPKSDGSTYHTAACYVRSSWSTHNQQNRKKLGAYFQLDVRRKDGTSGLPPGAVLTFRYQVDNQPWVSIPYTTPAGNDVVGTLLMQSVQPNSLVFPLVITLPNGGAQTGVLYRRVRWEAVVQRGSPATDTPVLASVALYYTFWQESHYAYQFAIDLSPETWDAHWGDGQLGPYTRDELVSALLGLNDTGKYHTLRIVGPGSLEENVGAVDVLVAGREDAERGGGVYTLTCRDLTADA
jgi:hypothetical protein